MDLKLYNFRLRKLDEAVTKALGLHLDRTVAPAVPMTVIALMQVFVGYVIRAAALSDRIDLARATAEGRPPVCIDADLLARTAAATLLQMAGFSAEMREALQRVAETGRDTVQG